MIARIVAAASTSKATCMITMPNHFPIQYMARGTGLLTTRWIW